MGRQHARRVILSGTIVLFISFTFVVFAFAWTGPSQSPPNANVSAPVNVGSTDQVKNAGLSLNALAVFGNAILSGASRYLNFGTTAGFGGYGIRDNAGVMQFKNNGGTWTAIGGSSGPTPWLVNGTHVYYNGGNVGIGTQNPAAKFEVTGGNTRIASYLQFKDFDDGDYVNPVSLIARDGNLVVWQGGLAVASPANGTLPDLADNDLYVQGNVGIGTAAPGYKLDVNGSLGVRSTTDFLLSDPASSRAVRFGYQDGSNYARILRYGSQYSGTPGRLLIDNVIGGSNTTGGYIDFRPELNRLTLYPPGGGVTYLPGTVSIGSATPGSWVQLYILGRTRSDGGIQVGSGAGASGIFRVEPNGDINSEGGIELDGSGIFKSGIDVYGPTWLSGQNVDLPNIPNNNGHFVCWQSGGSGRLRHQSAPCNQSDARLKENIAPLKAGLAEILRLKPVTFEWKDKEISGEGTKIGLIAQDVMEVFPELITGSGEAEKEEWYGIDYTALIAPMIKSIQELKAENDELRAELKELRELVENK